ncbi:hypothetical protein BT63DRAFT_478127 [Microthyrium microscopicum]|uniref:Uncharacterized protein n=1 Tax=Microthyrium microscopicum TaxID=703497 RepID=A0A6A6UCL0_9PEZI|nr:hypothetical protein BT63DRAFT_478127 [Microthyrium microscopicum]
MNERRLVVLKGNWSEWVSQLRVYLHISQTERHIDLSQHQATDAPQDPVHVHNASKPKAPLAPIPPEPTPDAIYWCHVDRMNKDQEWREYTVAMKAWENDEMEIRNLRKFMYSTIEKVEALLLKEARTPTEIFRVIREQYSIGMSKRPHLHHIPNNHFLDSTTPIASIHDTHCLASTILDFELILTTQSHIDSNFVKMATEDNLLLSNASDDSSDFAESSFLMYDSDNSYDSFDGLIKHTPEPVSLNLPGGPFPLMELPGETRMMIYRELFVDPSKECDCCGHKYDYGKQRRRIHRRSELGSCIQFLQTSKTIHNEASYVLYGENTFHFHYRHLAPCPTLLRYGNLMKSIYQMDHGLVQEGNWRNISYLLLLPNVRHIQIHFYLDEAFMWEVTKQQLLQTWNEMIRLLAKDPTPCLELPRDMLTTTNLSTPSGEIHFVLTTAPRRLAKMYIEKSDESLSSVLVKQLWPDR